MCVKEAREIWSPYQSGKETHKYIDFTAKHLEGWGERESAYLMVFSLSQCQDAKGPDRRAVQGGFK